MQLLHLAEVPVVMEMMLDLIKMELLVVQVVEQVGMLMEVPRYLERYKLVVVILVEIVDLIQPNILEIAVVEQVALQAHLDFTL